jgi:hypothetical protein
MCNNNKHALLKYFAKKSIFNKKVFVQNSGRLNSKLLKAVPQCNCEKNVLSPLSLVYADFSKIDKIYDKEVTYLVLPFSG